MIKTLLAICLVAAVKAEADPFYAYGYAGVPFGSSTGLDPITQGLDASTQGFAPYAHYGYGLGYGHYYGKRSAVAAAVPFGSSTGLDPITQGLDASTQGVAPYAYYGHYYGKRSADADAYYAYGYPYAQ